MSKCEWCNDTGYDCEFGIRPVCCGCPDDDGSCCGVPNAEQVPYPCRECNGELFKSTQGLI